MNYIKTFEQYSEFSGAEHVDEIFGMGKSGREDSLKEKFMKYASAPVWQKKPYFLYLGGDKFVKLSKASDNDKKSAFEMIKEQGQKDKLEGGIGIYSGDKTKGNSFVLYKPASAISWSLGGGADSGHLMTPSASTKTTPEEFKAIGDAILPAFEKFVETMHP